MRTPTRALLAGLMPLLLPTLAAAQAGSGVTVYGLFDAATRSADNAGSGGRLTTMEDGIITGSRLGLRGREDLGSGWAAQFTIESGFDPSTGTSLQATTAADFGQDHQLRIDARVTSVDWWPRARWARSPATAAPTALGRWLPASFDDRQSGSAALEGLRQVSCVTLRHRF